MKTNVTVNTTEMVKKFENLFDKITKTQAEIKTKTAIKNEYIINNANPVFEKVMNEINTAIRLINGVFPLDEISKLLNWNAVRKEQLVNENKSYIQVSFNLIKKQCELLFKIKGRASIFNMFYAEVTTKREWRKCTSLSPEEFHAYTLTCEEFMDIFGTIDNIYVILDLFKEATQETLKELQKKLQELQEQSDKILIPQLEDTKGDDNEKSIVLGELDGYQIVFIKKKQIGKKHIR